MVHQSMARSYSLDRRVAADFCQMKLSMDIVIFTYEFDSSQVVKSSMKEIASAMDRLGVIGWYPTLFHQLIWHVFVLNNSYLLRLTCKYDFVVKPLHVYCDDIDLPWRAQFVIIIPIYAQVATSPSSTVFP